MANSLLKSFFSTNAASREKQDLPLKYGVFVDKKLLRFVTHGNRAGRICIRQSAAACHLTAKQLPTCVASCVGAVFSTAASEDTADNSTGFVKNCQIFS
ncbi:hypothetical protein ACO0LO_20160 [Undibacterium sp. TJN25]|uniref:hypothetical protein n=1 Tax=Undibacterium sp. TJN25 TaxID=3413056 RepID=UPI003BEFCC51